MPMKRKGGNRRPLGKSQFSGNQRRVPLRERFAVETRFEKKLRKGIEAYRDVNFFKAVTEYVKVSKGNQG